MAKKHKGSEDVSDLPTEDTATETAPPRHTELTDEQIRELKEHAARPDTNGNGDVALAEKEPKDQRFRRLAVKRVPRAVKAINAVANLSLRTQYDYTIDQREKVLNALRDALKECERRFNGQRQTASFEL